MLVEFRQTYDHVELDRNMTRSFAELLSPLISPLDTSAKLFSYSRAFATDPGGGTEGRRSVESRV